MPFGPGIRLPGEFPPKKEGTKPTDFVGPKLPPTSYPSDFIGPLPNEIEIPHTYLATGPDGRKHKITSKKPLGADQVEQILTPFYATPAVMQALKAGTEPPDEESIISEAPAPDRTKPLGPEAQAAALKTLENVPQPEMGPSEDVATRAAGLQKFAQSISETDPEKMNVLTNPLAPVIQGIARLPEAFEAGGKRMERGANQIAGRIWGVNPEIMKERLTGVHGEEPTPGTAEGDLVKGIGNLLLGFGHPLFSTFMAATPPGMLINTASAYAGLDPRVKNVEEYLMTPAARMKIAQSLGIKDEEAANLLNEGLDLAAQMVILHKVNKATGAQGGFELSRELAERTRGVASTLRTKLEGKGITFGEQPAGAEPALAGKVIPATFDKEAHDLLMTCMRNAARAERSKAKKVTPIPEFKTTGEAETFGKESGTPEAVKEMQQKREELLSQVEKDKPALKNAKTPEERRSIADRMLKVGSQAQFLREASEAAQSSIVPGAEQLATGVRKAGRGIVDFLERGKGTPVVQTNKKIGRIAEGKIFVGSPGEEHGAMKTIGALRGLVGEKALTRGRISADKNSLVMMGDATDYGQQKLADLTFDLIQRGDLNKDAKVYFSEGSPEGVPIPQVEGGKMGASLIPGVTPENIDKLKQQLVNIATTGEGVSMAGIEGARKLADQSKDLFTTEQRDEITTFISDLQEKLKSRQIAKSAVFDKAEISRRQAELDRLKTSLIPGLPEPGSEGWEAFKKTAGKYAGSINLNRMNLDEETKKKMRDQAAEIKKPLEDFLGRSLTDEEVSKAAIEATAFREVLPQDVQRQIAAQVLKLRQSVAEGAKGQSTKQYLADFVTLQSVAKFAGRLLQKFTVEAEPLRSLGGNAGAAREAVLNRLLNANVDVNKIVERGQNVDWNDANAVAKFYREFVKPSKMELLDEFRYINMLSSPRTHIINAFSNVLQVGALAPATKLTTGLVDAVASSLTGKPRDTYLRETPAYLKGMFNAAPNAAKQGLDVLRGKAEIKRPDVGQIFREERIPSMGTSASKMGIPIAKFNQAFKSVTRALEASDIFFRTMAEGGETEAGLKHFEISGKPIDIKAIQDKAMKAAEYWVFRSPLDVKNETGQGSILSTIDAATNAAYKFRTVPGVKWFIPFVATPMNILKQGIEFSPTGFLTMIGSKRPAEQFSKALIGSTVLAGAAALVLNNESTWETPQNASERADFESQGKIPYAIKLGNTWVSYTKLGPLAYPIALAAGAKHYSTQDRLKNDAALKKIGAVTAGYAKFFSDQSYVQGIGDLIDLVRGEPKSIEAGISNMARQTVPLTAFQGWVNGLLDPNRRAPDNFMERIASGIPGLSANLPKRIGVMGQPLPRAPLLENLGNLSPLPASRNTADPVWRALMKKRIRVGIPAKTVFGEQLNQKQYQSYIKRIGERIHVDLADIVTDPSFVSLPRTDAQEQVDEIVRKARKEVREEMFPDLQEREALQKEEEVQ